MMKIVLVTGSSGFLGSNLCTALARREDIELIRFDREDPESLLDEAAGKADVIYHLAGINRPESDDEFVSGNVGLTSRLISSVEAGEQSPVLVLSSSIQADRDSPYGRSKLAAEEEVLKWQARSGAPACIYRFANLFGKWSQPEYNTVVATFCHNVARGLEITISDPNVELELCYIDDVVAALLCHVDNPPEPEQTRWTVSRTFRVTLGDLAKRIRSIAAIAESLVLPDLSEPLNRCLHATFLSFLPTDRFSSPVVLRRDERGWLFELIKSPHFGQIFVSTTHPGVTRGNHYHDSKVEKFCVIQGNAAIRFRHVHGGDVINYDVDDSDIQIVDIPPGYTHHIENVGDTEMIVLFWASEIFQPQRPDTYWMEVSQ